MNNDMPYTSDIRELALAYGFTEEQWEDNMKAQEFHEAMLKAPAQIFCLIEPSDLENADV